MKEIANQVHTSFREAKLNPPRTAKPNPANYLSQQLKYNPPKTMAKFLDEYNWVTITHQTPVPPDWPPQP